MAKDVLNRKTQTYDDKLANQIIKEVVNNEVRPIKWYEKIPVDWEVLKLSFMLEILNTLVVMAEQFFGGAIPATFDFLMIVVWTAVFYFILLGFKRKAPGKYRRIIEFMKKLSLM